MPIIGGRTSSSKSDKSTIGTSRKISRKLDLLDQKVDGLYRDIYITRPDNKHNLENIINKLDDAIDNMQNGDYKVSDMSELLRRIDLKDGSNVSRLMNSVGELFNDQNLLNSLFANEDMHRYISSQNYQYDMICKYLPKLEKALKIKKNNVLSSDNFSKKFLNPKSNKTSKTELDKFDSNADRIEKLYEISDFLEKSYDLASKYGEDFVYIVPYSIAFERVIKRTNSRKNTARLGQISFYESVKPEVCINEGFAETDSFKEYCKKVSLNSTSNNSTETLNKFKGSQVNLYFNDSNVISESINERLVLENLSEVETFTSMAQLYFGEASSLQQQFMDVDKKNNGLSAAVGDGLIVPDNLKDPDKIDKNMLGAVIERLPRENVIPIYIGKVCMGYYYMEFREDKDACGYCGGRHMSTMGSLGTTSNTFGYAMSENQEELAIRYIASRISASIDTHFINKNKDLKEEIYAILRYNEKFDISRSNDISVTFIPADDIVHCYLNFDDDSHRGISDLKDSVVYGMLYILLYLTDIIGKVTRSTDKRVYYVKQNVETNVARTMMNVVQQIKKGNMGMRQIESMNNILNIVGKYNDYIIPLGQSGDPPIQFEVMQGQDIQTPSEIMDKMEEGAVNAIMPIELVNSTMQQDFAIRYTMTNTEFLKDIYTAQRKTEKFFSKIYTKVYNYEFGENISQIEIILPPPIFLALSNNQQLFDNVMQQADKIIEVDLSSESDEVKAEFKKLYARNLLSTYVDFALVERLKSAAKVNVETRKSPKAKDGETSSDDYDEY